MCKTTKKSEQAEKNERSPKNPSLDTITKMVRQNDDLDFRLRIWKMRNIASGILTFLEETELKQEKKYPRICLCGRYHHKKRESSVLVAKGENSGRSFFSNLVSCGSVWRCPVCSYKITKVRQVEVFKLLSWYHKNDYKMSFLTLTLRHKNGDVLGDLLDKLLSEFRKFQRVRKYRTFAETYIGMVKATEITYSEKHGWHPHLHIVFIHKKHIRHQEVKMHMDNLLLDWCNRKNVNGNMGGQKYKPVYDESDLVDYITKWDASKEISNGSFKLTQEEKKQTKKGKKVVKRNVDGRTTAFGIAKSS